MSRLKSSYKILQKDNIVIEYHSGVLEVEAYINFKKRLLKDPLFKANFNHFIHFKNVVFKTSPTDINHFVEFIKNNVQSLGFRKIALVTNTPNQVVSTTMYKMMIQNNNQNTEVFSTNNSALTWLNPPHLSSDELTAIILELKNQ